jgi:eukaryotic-like serine/threonine-protein kinase
VEVHLRSSIADYQVVRVLPAAGGDQPRYLCRSPDRFDDVAAEVMLTELPVDASGWRELTRDLGRLAAVRSQRLLTLIEVGPDLDPDGRGVYLTTEFAPGGSLGDPTTPLDPASTVQAVAEAALGAHQMHEVGITHGAIDAGTILLTERGAVLAPRVLAEPPGRLATIASWRDVVVLDPALLRGELPSRSSDVWGLAATLHGLVSTRPLYRDIERDPTVTAVQRVLFTRPEVDETLPVWLVETLKAAFASDPRDRLDDASELAVRLGATASEGPGGGPRGNLGREGTRIWEHPSGGDHDAGPGDYQPGPGDERPRPGDDQAEPGDRQLGVGEHQPPGYGTGGTGSGEAW